MNSEVGDLIYIPSATDLLQYRENFPTKVMKIDSPTNLLILEKKDTKLGVLFQGEIWYVEKRKVYNV